MELTLAGTQSTATKSNAAAAIEDRPRVTEKRCVVVFSDFLRIGRRDSKIALSWTANAVMFNKDGNSSGPKFVNYEQAAPGSAVSPSSSPKRQRTATDGDEALNE